MLAEKKAGKHWEAISKLRWHVCKICGKKYKTYPGIYYHIDNKHKDEIRQAKPKGHKDTTKEAHKTKSEQIIDDNNNEQVMKVKYYCLKYPVYIGIFCTPTFAKYDETEDLIKVPVGSDNSDWAFEAYDWIKTAYTYFTKRKYLCEVVYHKGNNNRKYLHLRIYTPMIPERLPCNPFYALS